jgi:predicted SAM-dependent methyltransferase
MPEGPTRTGIRLALGNLLAELGIFLIHWKGLLQARRFLKSSDLKLHLGCGKNLKEGWVNIDLHKRADVRLDLRETLPFHDNTCSMIYSEHFLEHVDYPEPVTSLLKECYRVLKPGGVLSVVVPDIELVLRSYVEGGTEEYYAAQRKWHPEWCKTQMEHVNYNFRQDNEHRFCYDFETLECLLKKCGFVEAQRRSIDLELDSKEREFGSLYVDAIKPTNALSQAQQAVVCKSIVERQEP